MTVVLMSSLPSADMPEKKKIASSRVRQPLDRSIQLTELDTKIAADVFALGIADTKSLLLLAASHAGDARHLLHRTRRFTQLWRAGLWSRIDPNLTYLKGSAARIYCFETGRGQLSYQTRTHYTKISDETAREIAEQVTPHRRQTIDFLVSLGFSADLVESRIESNADALCRFYSGAPSQVPHRVLGAQGNAILWYGARSRGLQVGNIRPDGDLKFSVLVGKDDVTLKPDMFYTLGSTGIAVEIETGTAGRKKVTDKIRAYLALFKKGLPQIKRETGAYDMTELTTLFYCGTTAHARMIEDVLSGFNDPHAKFFRVVTSKDMGVDATDDSTPIHREHIVSNAEINGAPVLAYFKDRIAAPIFRRKTPNGFLGFPLLG